jgi:imidazoleglycerol-phosphate dehydratase/histidinol-phosphatase
MTRILFLDRDGVLLEEPPDEQVDSFAKFRLVPGVVPALLRLRDAGFEFVMVTNQDGLGTPSFPREAFEGPQQLLLQVLASQGIAFRDVFVDTHRPEDNHPDRKPGIGMVLPYLRDRGIDLDASAMVGDRETDLQFAANLGVRGLRLGPGFLDWPAIAHLLADAPRTARVERTTRETRIVVEVDLDPAGAERARPPRVATGLGFLDHMLAQLAAHGGFDLALSCDGDLHVDEHHTVEDCALALGQALARAVGDKRGLARYGFVLPMDEARAGATLDWSGRPGFHFSGAFPRERVGDVPTELLPHFFRSLCEAAGLTLHLEVTGENAHHMAEACFKVVARALRQALARTGRELPSTKGAL